MTDVTCPACEGSDVRPWAVKAGHAIRQCHGCGALSSVPNATASTELYARYYDASTFETPVPVAASLTRLVVAAERFRRLGRWLDVGYGEGGLLGAAERKGWACHGVEVSPQALEYGRRRGWTVTAEVDDTRLGDAAFDVVSMIELVEHVAEPRRLFEAAGRWLRAGGLLYLTTPNAGSLNRRLLAEAWSVIAPPARNAERISTRCGGPAPPRPAILPRGSGPT